MKEWFALVFVKYEMSEHTSPTHSSTPDPTPMDAHHNVTWSIS
jgi:hypothetical protein